MPNIKLTGIDGNEKIYPSVNSLTLPTAEGGTHTFFNPDGVIEISANDTYNVSAYETARVHVSAPGPSEDLPELPDISTWVDQSFTVNQDYKLTKANDGQNTWKLPSNYSLTINEGCTLYVSRNVSYIKEAENDDIKNIKFSAGSTVDIYGEISAPNITIQNNTDIWFDGEDSCLVCQDFYYGSIQCDSDAKAGFFCASGFVYDCSITCKTLYLYGGNINSNCFIETDILINEGVIEVGQVYASSSYQSDYSGILLLEKSDSDCILNSLAFNLYRSEPRIFAYNGFLEITNWDGSDTIDPNHFMVMEYCIISENIPDNVYTLLDIVYPSI